MAYIVKLIQPWQDVCAVRYHARLKTCLHSKYCAVTPWGFAGFQVLCHQVSFTIHTIELPLWAMGGLYCRVERAGNEPRIYYGGSNTMRRWSLLIL